MHMGNQLMSQENQHFEKRGTAKIPRARVNRMHEVKATFSDQTLFPP